MTTPHELRTHDEHSPPNQKVRNEPLGPDLQHTFGHIDCPACGATNPMGDDPDELAEMLFPIAAKKWLKTKKKLKPRTRYGYEQSIERLNVFFEHLQLKKIHLGHLRNYQVQRTANDITLDAFSSLEEIRRVHPAPIPGWPKVAGYSITNHELSLMQSVLKHAGLWEPFENKYESIPKTRTKKPKVLSDEQSLHLISKAQGRPAWELAFWIANITENTSAAGTELRHLLIEDLHDEDESMPWLFIDDENVKNDYRGRIIYLNPTALYYLRKCRTRAITLGCTDPKDHMFPLREKPGVWNPKRPAGSSWTRRCFASMREETGLDWLTPHCFRHQCTTLLFENDIDDMTMIHTLGHKAISMSRHYSHNRLKKQKAVLDAIDPTVRLGVQRVEYDPYEAAENKYSIRA